MFAELSAQGGPKPVGSFKITVPAAVFEDLPGLIPVLAASFMKSLPSED
jgi:hypothetical protein